MADDRAVKSWSVAGLKIDLYAERVHCRVTKSGTVERTQRWLPPHLTVSTLSALQVGDPETVLAVIDAFAEAGRALQDELAAHTSGTLL